MTSWPAVRWSSADQILATIGKGPPPPPEAAVEPAAWYRALAEQGKLGAAIDFIAHALPRYECVVWATRSVLDSGVSERSGELMSGVMRWIDDPQEASRRRVQQLTEAADSSRPEFLLGMAVFMSGGSISEPDLPVVLPKPDMTAKLGGGAVMLAASLGDPGAVMRRSIELGEMIAAAGPAR